MKFFFNNVVAYSGMTMCSRQDGGTGHFRERSALQINKMDGMTEELRTTINNTVHGIAVAKWKPLNPLKNPQRLLSSSTLCFITWSINGGRNEDGEVKTMSDETKWGSGADVHKSIGLLEKRWGLCVCVCVHVWFQRNQVQKYLLT